MNNAMLQLKIRLHPFYSKGPYSGLFPVTFNINSGYKKAGHLTNASQLRN